MKTISELLEEVDYLHSKYYREFKVFKDMNKELNIDEYKNNKLKYLSYNNVFRQLKKYAQLYKELVNDKQKELFLQLVNNYYELAINSIKVFTSLPSMMKL